MAASTKMMIAQRRKELLEEVFASDMNAVRLVKSVNHKQSRSARKGDLRHFYVSASVWGINRSSMLNGRAEP